jgi:uncharacterized protein YodC (DUF2158 family)
MTALLCTCPPNLVLLSGFLPLFQIGATVRLNSGGPLMTVTAFQEDHIEVQWFEGNDPKQKIYPVGALHHARTRRRVSV